MLNAADVGKYTPDAVPLPAERGIWFGEIPASATGEGIAITPYFDSPGMLASNTTLVQIRTRGSKNALTSLDITDEIRNLLHRRTHLTIGGIRIGLIKQESFSVLGTDGNGRHEFTQNFSLLGMRGQRI